MTADRPNRSLTLLAGIGIGAALMYFLDPDRGARRRNMAADRATKALRQRSRDAVGAAQNARNHALGAAAELRGLMQHEDVEDDQLVARVRAELGHHARHTSGIEVVVHEGCVVLRGPVLADEVVDVVRTVAAVRGVHRVDNQLDVHANAGNTPALQG
jgi:osmotically-inducible protein OsmY